MISSQFLLLMFQWALFVCGLFSLAVYLLVLITLIRYRHLPYINAPFYRLIVSSGIADFLHTIHSWLAFRIYPWGWLFGWVPADDEEDFHGSTMFIKIMITSAQIIGLMLLSAERVSAAVWPFKHMKVWSPAHVYTLCVVQWLLAMLTAYPCRGLRLSWVQNNQSFEFMSFSNQSTQFSLAYYTLGSLSILLIVTFVIPFVYLFLIYYMNNYQRKSTMNNPTHGEDRIVHDKADLKLTICGLLITLSQILPIFLAVFAGLAENFGPILLIYCASQDFANYVKPFVLLLFGKLLRKYSHEQIRCRKMTRRPSQNEHQLQRHENWGFHTHHDDDRAENSTTRPLSTEEDQKAVRRLPSLNRARLTANLQEIDREIDLNQSVINQLSASPSQTTLDLSSSTRSVLVKFQAPKSPVPIE